MKKLLFLLLLLTQSALATAPLFSLVPQGTLPTSVSPGGTVTALYTLTNNSSYPLNDLGLNYQPQGKTPVGVTQNTAGVNTPPTCASPINLSAGASCTLSLTITADDLVNSLAIGGPEICYTADNPTRCSVPLPGAELNVQISSSTAYVSSRGNNLVYKCSIDLQTGLFVPASCVDSGAASLSQPDYISFHKFSNQNYAYLGQDGVPPTQCQVSAQGFLSNCTSVGSPFFSVDTAFNTASNGTTYAYVAGAVPGDPIYQCLVNASVPEFTGCVDPVSVGGFPYSSGATQTVFATFGGTRYAYVTNGYALSAGSIEQFSVQSDGSFVSTYSSLPINGPIALVFTQVNGSEYAYWVDWFESRVYQCPVNTSNGQISSSCTQMLSLPHQGYFVDIALNVTSQGQFVYITDEGTGSGGAVWVCALDSSTGVFTSCEDSGEGTFFNSPYGITLQ